jgi:putative intracellular protease/amidase
VNIAIPLFPGFTALDAIGPYEVLSRLPGADVVFVAEQPGLITTDTGRPTFEVTVGLTEVPAPDVVVVPGGFGTRAIEAAPDGPLVRWLRGAHPTTTFTTSVCTGALVLGAAGLLRGLEATTYWALVDRLARHGAIPVRRRVVRQGKIITAAGVSAGIDMALVLAAELAGPDVARAIQLGIEYDPAPPFDAGSPAKAGEDIVARVLASRPQEPTTNDPSPTNAPRSTRSTVPSGVRDVVPGR